MMSCIFDDEEVSGESSSAGSSCSVTVGQEQQQSLTKEKMNLKSRFIKKKPTAGNTSTNNNKSPNNGQKVQSRVQRSASAILRSKMYAVVAKKRKISKPTMDQPSAEENNIGMLPSLNTQSCIKGLWVVRDFCFWAYWAARPVLKKKIWADYEQLLRAGFSCFQGQKKCKFFF